MGPGGPETGRRAHPPVAPALAAAPDLPAAGAGAAGGDTRSRRAPGDDPRAPHSNFRISAAARSRLATQR